MKKTLLTLGVFVLVLGLVGCGKTPTLKNGEEIIAEVDGKKFTVEDLYEKLKAQGGETTLVNMIDEFLVNKEVETDEDAKTYAESQIESYKSSYESYSQDFNEALKQAGYKDEDAFKEALIVEYKKQKIAEDYIKDNITEVEIDEYYADNIFGDIDVKHILIAPDVDDNATDEEKEEAEKKAKEEAEKIIKKLDKGENFEDLAKEYSDDKGTAKNGGKLTATYGEVVDEFWNAANELKNKKYTKEPVKTEYGYHIIYRIKGNDKPELKDVKDEIIEKIVQEKLANNSSIVTEALVELRKKYNLKINDSDIKKTYNTNIKEALANNENSSN